MEAIAGNEGELFLANPILDAALQTDHQLVAAVLNGLTAAALPGRDDDLVRVEIRIVEIARQPFRPDSVGRPQPRIVACGSGR